MTSVEYVDQLVRCQDPDGALLSVYVTVPAEVAALREMFVRLDGLLGAVSPPAAARAAIRRAVAGEVERVRDTVVEHARDWLDHGVAIVSSAALGLHEAVPVRAPVPDRAVVGVRPHVRPLLAALRQARPYVVAVVDRRHAWLYRVDGDDLAATGQLVGKGVRDRSHGGWAGLQEYGVRHRAAELARRHYRSTAAELASLLGASDDDLIVGGHDVSIAEFLEMLPKSLRIRVTGTFSIDPHTMTIEELRVRGAGARVHRRTERERQLGADLADLEAGGMAVSGLAPCAEAVSRCLTDLLVVGGSDLEPGYVCDSCGDLVVDGPACACGNQARTVPDLIDEMVTRVVRHRGRVEFVDASGTADSPPVVARLRGRVNRRVS